MNSAQARRPIFFKSRPQRKVLPLFIRRIGEANFVVSHGLHPMFRLWVCISYTSRWRTNQPKFGNFIVRDWRFPHFLGLLWLPKSQPNLGRFFHQTLMVSALHTLCFAFECVYNMCCSHMHAMHFPGNPENFFIKVWRFPHYAAWVSPFLVYNKNTLTHRTKHSIVLLFFSRIHRQTLCAQTLQTLCFAFDCPIRVFFPVIRRTWAENVFCLSFFLDSIKFMCSHITDPMFRLWLCITQNQLVSLFFGVSEDMTSFLW